MHFHVLLAHVYAKRKEQGNRRHS